MKWFKHIAASWDDEGLAKLIGKGGMEGLARYGLWWRVVEIVASQLGPKGTNPSVCYPVTRWSLLLSLRGSLVFSTLSTLVVTGGVTVERDGDNIRVTIPNLLKYRDEYSKKSGHDPESVGAKNRTDGDGEEEEEEKTIALSDEKPRSEPTLPPPTTPAPRRLGTLPLNDGSLYEITDVLVAEWQELYPAVDVVQECKSMKGWCIGNPTKLKTRKGVLRFITSWLEREQDRGGSKRPMNGNGAHANGNSVREGNDERIARINRQLEKPGGDSDLTGRRVQV
jgi:hypothetical protein